MKFGRKTLEAIGIDPDRAAIVEDFIRTRDRERVAIQQAEGIYAGVDLMRKRPTMTPFSEPVHGAQALNEEAGDDHQGGEGGIRDRRNEHGRLNQIIDVGSSARACPACCDTPRAPPPASSSRMARAPAWRIRSWRRSRAGLRSAASRACATSFPTWRKAASAPIRRRSRMRRCAPPSRRRGGSFPKLPLIAGGKSFGGRMTSQAQAAGAARRCRRARVPWLPAASGEEAHRANAPRISPT